MNKQVGTSDSAPLRGYQAGQDQSGIRQFLHRNEGGRLFDSVVTAGAELDADQIRRYPDANRLSKLLAENYAIEADRLVLTAGGDQAIETLFRLTAFEKSSRGASDGPMRVLTHAPGFEMFEIYARNLQADLQTIPWFDQEFPVAAFADRLNVADAPIDLLVLVSPNNPTGRAIPAKDVESLCHLAKQRGARVLLDQAYVEFAGSETRALAGEQYWQQNAGDHVFRIRTLSKAWGLAGLRVGAALTPNADLAERMRAILGPFPVSAASLAMAAQALTARRQQMEENVRKTIEHRQLAANCLTGGPFRVLPSEANFLLLAERPGGDLSASELARQLADQGIAVRTFNQDGMRNTVRLTLPVDTTDFQHLLEALQPIASEIPSADQTPKRSVVGPGPGPSQTNATPANPQTRSADSVMPSQTQEHAAMTLAPRTAICERETRETRIRVEVNLDGTGQANISTGLGFLDHMLNALACHSRIDISLQCAGDLQVDDHHTVEDCALCLGAALEEALGDKAGIQRFSSQYAPLDESLVRAVIDLSGRPASEIHLDFARELVGQVATENLTHFFVSLASTLRCALHLDTIRGRNDHHKAEAAFKALALALRQAIAQPGRAQSPTSASVPSTKGVLN